MAVTPGTRVGPYEVVGPLGAGGMGEVYRATDTRLGRTVALKILPAAVSHDQERLRRFEVEAKAVAELSHPNILTIFEFGRDADTAYAALELVDGVTLRSVVAGGCYRFLPDGRGLVYLPHPQSLDFCLLDLVTKAPRQLTRLDNRGNLRTFDITPDGKHIVFDRSRENSDIVLIELPKK